MNDPLGAFIPGEPLSVAGASEGPLAGFGFAAKDVFDIAGHRTGNGQPTWLETHPAADRHAAAVACLLEAGASLVGKTVCDEMCYSLSGDNAHYGAPANPAAPDRFVGGSSSGSASAVAGGFADFALGTDCGGSVRCPASFAGLLGIRPSHGRVDDAGVVPLAPSFDVVGWFARDTGLFRRVGGVLLDDHRRELAPGRALVATDAFARLPAAEASEAHSAAISLVERLGLERNDVTLAPEGLDHWFEAFRHLQALEIWANHGAWVTRQSPSLGPGVRERFAFAATLGEDDRTRWQPVREAARSRIAELLGDDGIVVLPTAAVALRRDAGAEEIDSFRASTMGLTCAAGLSGYPQVSLPLATCHGAPMGISILGPRGSDEALLDLAGVACAAT